MEKVPISKIVVPQGLLPRVLTGTVQEKVDEYAELLQAGVEFPPIVVWERDGEYWLVDGAHRLSAYRKLGYEEVPVKVVELKDELELRLMAIRENAKHGLPLRREEKKILARTLYELAVPVGEIASALGVALRTVYVWTEDLRQEQERKLKETVRELLEKGKSVRQIAQETGISKSGVWKTARKLKEEVSYEEFKAVVWEEFKKEPTVENLESIVFNHFEADTAEALLREHGSELLREYAQSVALFDQSFEERLKELLLEIVDALGKQKAKELVRKVFREVFHE